MIHKTQICGVKEKSRQLPRYAGRAMKGIWLAGICGMWSVGALAQSPCTDFERIGGLTLRAP